MTLPVNPGPDLPGPTPPVQPIDAPDVLPLDPERESEPDAGKLPHDKPEHAPDDPSIGDVLRDLS